MKFLFRFFARFSVHCACLLILFCSSASELAAIADDSLRIPRPTFIMPDALRFSIGREKRFTDQFKQWRRQYCHPVICPDIACAGSCAVYADSCPSFNGLTIFDVRDGSVNLLIGGGCSSQCADDVESPMPGFNEEKPMSAGCCH